MKFIYTIFFIIGLSFMMLLNAQTGTSVADAIPVDFSSSNTVVFNNVSTENGGSSVGVNGGCTANCCSTFVYIVTIPQEGALFVKADAEVPLSSSVLGYTGPANATTNADLTYYPAPGNFCGFRDTLYFSYIPAGTYYIHYFNHNNQTGQGVASANLTFEFTSNCDASLIQPEIELEGNNTTILAGDNTPSTIDDTDYGNFIVGDVPLSKTYTIHNSGNNLLDITNISVGGANAADFVVTSSSASTVTVNSSTTFTVEFTPSTIGMNTAKITVFNSDCDKSAYSFDIKASVLAVSPSDVRGNMLELNGSGEYVNINSAMNALDGATEFTIEAWINADATQTGNDHIVSINRANGDNEILFYVDDGKLVTYDGANDTYGSPELRGTGWHHVVLTHDNSNHSVYLDGVLLGTKAGAVAALSSSHLCSIGQEYDNGSGSSTTTGDFFKGKMDEIRIWKDVRTIEEIRENMHLTFSKSDIANFPNLAAYYQFDNDDAAATIDGVKDVLGNHGTSVGGIYSDSEVAVGAGKSVLLYADIEDDPTFFPETDLELYFHAGGSPYGEIVVTKIMTEKPYNLPSNQMTYTPDYYWIIRNYGNSGVDVNVKLEFQNGEIVDDVIANHTIHKRGSNEYGEADWTVLTPSQVSMTNNHVRVEVSSFSQFFISSNTSEFIPSVLPVELLHFNAKRFNNNTVQLDWQTASETNNKGFEIERLVGGKGEFERIGWVTGNGNTTTFTSYQFKDNNNYKGTSYYRLKQLDFDGRYEYSNIAAVHLSDDGNVGNFYPNPSETGMMNLDYMSTIAKEITITIYDLSGKILHTKIENVNDGMNQLSFNFSFLNQGVYLVNLNDGQSIVSRKIVIR